MELCNYGCGKKAKYQFKNGKQCCNKHYRQCPNQRKKISDKNNPFFSKKHTLKTKEILKNYAMDRKDSKETRKKKSNVLKGPLNPNYGKTWKDSKETRKKKSNANKGNIPWNKGKKNYLTKEQLKNISSKNKGRTPWNKNKKACFSIKTISNMRISSKLSIDTIKEKYPFFSKVEEMRYNPDKSKEIQVHCKNHNCKNSKEKGGWFTPTLMQIQCRKNQLEKQDGNDGSYFYCCQKCKEVCPLYGLQNDPYTDTDKPHTSAELNTLNQFVLKRDSEICHYCGEHATIVHHLRPQKLEPFFALDPDYAISVCAKCHYKYGHPTGSKHSTGNLAKLVCK